MQSVDGCTDSRARWMGVPLAATVLVRLTVGVAPLPAARMMVTVPLRAVARSLCSALLVSSVLIPLGATGLAHAQQGPFLYLPDPVNNTVSTFDTATNAVVGSTVPVGSSPFAAAVRGDGSTVYVTNANSNNVSVINTATNTVSATVAVGTQPEGVAVSPDGRTVYVVNNNAGGSGSVSVINVANNTVSATIPVGTGPAFVALNPDGSRAYVSNSGSNSVSVIDTRTNTIITTISSAVFTAPTGLAVNRDGSLLFVATGTGVSVINTATNTPILPQIPTTSSPQRVAFSRDGTLAFVLVATGVNVISGGVGTFANNNFVDFGIGAFTGGLAVAPNGTPYISARGINFLFALGPPPAFSSPTLFPIGAGSGDPGICSNGNALLASGLTFKANTSGALACTLTSGPTGASGPVFTGGTMQFAGANIASALPIALMAAGGTFDTAGNHATLSGTISGPGGLTKIGLGTLTLSGAGSYAGPTAVNAGTLQGGAVNAFSPSSAFTVATGAVLDLNSFNQTIGSLAGSGTVTLASATLTTGNDGTSTTFSGTMSGSGGLAKVGSGTFVLTGTNAYTGPTNINAGTLQVDGSIATSSLTSVNSGGTLIGIGTVGGTRINSGGIFAPGSGAPGTSMTVAGNLAFQSGALYLVQVNPTNTTSANASGSATLSGGSVQAVLAPGSYTIRSYDILHATGGLGGTSFSGLSLSNPNFSASPSYSATDVFLNLTGATLGGGIRLNPNQQNVASAIDAFFNAGGTLPPQFGTIFGLTGPALAGALSQLTGEAATGAQDGAFQLMNTFLTMVIDPFVEGRGGIGGSPASNFAPERDSLPPEIALAYARVFKAPPAAPQRLGLWNVWGAAYGGGSNISGDPVAGTNDVTARTYGFATGADYHVTPDTLIGFALAGGGTKWDLAQGLGGGKSDAFQAGLYAKSHFGPAYVAASLAFANHWMSTNRLGPMADQLTASFNAQSYGGRIEGGYRFAVTPASGITPYAALQAQSFRTPSYMETDVTGGGFGLGFNARNATDTRSEVGARFEQLAAVGGYLLTLHGRLAWAHDFLSDPTLSAAFQALPGASFIVNGASPARDHALTTFGADYRLAPNWMLSAKFEGELAAKSQTYAGVGKMIYSW